MAIFSFKELGGGAELEDIKKLTLSPKEAQNQKEARDKIDNPSIDAPSKEESGGSASSNESPSALDQLKGLMLNPQEQKIMIQSQQPALTRGQGSDFSWLKSTPLTKPDADELAATKESTRLATDELTPQENKKQASFYEKISDSTNETDKQPFQENLAYLEKDSFEKEKTKNEEVTKFDWETKAPLEEPSADDFVVPNEATGKPKWDVSKKTLDAPKNTSTETQRSLQTTIDKMFELLETYRRMDSGELANQLNVDSGIIENIAKLFENEGILQLQYIMGINKKPMIILEKEIESKIKSPPKGKLLESYLLDVDYVPANISIVSIAEEARPVYVLEIPFIGKYTRKFLDFIKNQVAETMPVEIEEILDPKKSKELKKRFFTELNKTLVQYFPDASPDLLNTLSGIVLHEMYGLGDIEVVMGDDMLEEVAINSAKTPITVYHRIHGWLKTNLYPGTEDDISNYASQIGRKVGREITTLSPILDAHLLSGDRVNATLFPISSEGNTLTIRRFARRPWTMIDFIGRTHTMNTEMAALLWLAMQYEMNVVVAGGTASGKTSTLNTLLALVPSYHRIISIEDVREIILPKYLDWNWIPMVTRSANPEGLGEVTMLDLMLSSLRMRPDRIIVGEIRRKREAEVLMEAIETGHSIYSTIHANSAYQVLRRLAEAPMSIPLMQIELIDLVIVQYRDRKTNKRRTYEIAEIEQTSTGQGLQVNTVYKWTPRSDSWEQLNKPAKILTLLNLHTGLTEEEVYRELDDRKFILEWMRNNNINGLNVIGFVAKLFYSDPERVKTMARKNTSLKTLQEMMQ